MSAADADATPPRSGAARRLPAWKLLLLLVAGLMAVAGLVLHAVGAAQSAAPHDRTASTQRQSGSGGAPALGPMSFMPGSEDGAGTADGAGGDDAGSGSTLAPLFTKLGFGFFVGFCIGYALRVAFKISILAIGVILLAVLGLSYAGVLDVDWSAMHGRYDSAVEWLTSQFTSLRTFIQGQVPSSASAGFGLFVGFRK